MAEKDIDEATIKQKISTIMQILKNATEMHVDVELQLGLQK